MLFSSKTIDSATGANRGKQFSLINGGLEPSNFGLFGQEDLGGGLKATFRLESGVSVVNGGFDNSNGNLFGRQAWLALNGNFGELKAGVQYSPFVLAIYESDPRNAGQFGTAFSVYADNTFVGTFNPNAITYTAKFAGFSGSAMYAFGGVPGDYRAGSSTARRALRISRAGRERRDVRLEFRSQLRGLTTFQQPFSGRMIGVGYHFDRLTVKAVHQLQGADDGGGRSRERRHQQRVNVGFDYYALPQLDINGGVVHPRSAQLGQSRTARRADDTLFSVEGDLAVYAGGCGKQPRPRAIRDVDRQCAVRRAGHDGRRDRRDQQAILAWGSSAVAPGDASPLSSGRSTEHSGHRD